MLPKIVVLTGAGISAESGLKTFRDNNGLWENHRIEEVATPEAFEVNPALVYRFYNLRRAQLISDEVTENKAHRALAKLEAFLGDNFTLVTQNVDDLHERAGSTRLYHMHGKLLSARCVESGLAVPYKESFDEETQCDCCKPGNLLRPDIVWFGEIPMFMDEIVSALTQCDIFISIGTSGQVYPAANFVAIAAENGARTIELNLETSMGSGLFDEVIHGSATHVVPMWVDDFIATR